MSNLLCFASEGKTFYYGAIGAGFKNWLPWHSTEDREEILQDMRTVLKSAERLLYPKTLLEILQSFVVFSTVKQGAGKPSFKIKILPRYPQYEAAKAIVERVKTQDARKELIWHLAFSGFRQVTIDAFCGTDAQSRSLSRPSSNSMKWKLMNTVPMA